MKSFGEWLNDFNTEDNKQEEILQELSDLGQSQGEDGFYSRSLEDMIADDDGVLSIDDTFDILAKKNVSGFEYSDADLQECIDEIKAQERIDRCVQQIRDSSDSTQLCRVGKLYLDEEIERIKQQAIKEYRRELITTYFNDSNMDSDDFLLYIGGSDLEEWSESEYSPFEEYLLQKIDNV